MDNSYTRVFIALSILLVTFPIIYVRQKKSHKIFTVSFIVKTSIFAALSIVLYTVPVLKFPLPIFPSFLEIHLDEIPIFISSFAYGPLSGIFIIIIRTLVKLPLTTTLGVGELIDFLYSLVFIIPASLIYQKHRNFKGATMSLIIGLLLQVTIASFITSFVMLDFYALVLGIPKEVILNMCKAINPNITSLGWPFLFYVALPFNLIKDAIVIVLTLLLYKKLHKIIDKIPSK